MPYSIYLSMIPIVAAAVLCGAALFLGFIEARGTKPDDRSDNQ